MRIALLLLAASLTLTACASAGDPPVAEPTGGPTEVSSLLLQPMGNLPSCGPPPQPGVTEPVPGQALPEGAVVQSSSQTGQLTQLLGYVPLTPVQLMVAMRELDGVTVLQSEHEQFESEVLYETADHRGFIKAQVACATGSNFVQVVASKEASGAVPTPTGGATGPG